MFLSSIKKFIGLIKKEINMKFDLQGLIEQARKMQEELDKKKQTLASKTVTAESGGGLVQVTMNCNYRITSMHISKEVINPDDSEMIRDLVIAAVNKALMETGKVIESEMGSLSNMLPNIPGMGL